MAALNETRDVVLARQITDLMVRRAGAVKPEFGMTVDIEVSTWGKVVDLLDRNLGPPTDAELDAINAELLGRSLPANNGDGWRGLLREIIEKFQHARQGGPAPLSF